MKNEQSFNSKILLFGEYSIIQDSMGLTLPYNEFNGKLTFDADEMNEQFVSESNEHLLEFANYIQTLLNDKKLNIDFDIDAFRKDIANGNVFPVFHSAGFWRGQQRGIGGGCVWKIYQK